MMRDIHEYRLENLKKLIAEVGSATELAKLAGYKQPSYLYQILNRTALQNGKPKNIGSNMARKLERATNKPEGWLDTQRTDKPRLRSSNDPLPEDYYMFVPFLKESEYTDGGSFGVLEYNGFWLPFGKSTLYLKNIQPENVFCCTLNGNSMKPRIAEDAIMAIDKGAADIIKDGKIYAFQHDDLFRVKYLYRVPSGKIRIHSENNEYPDEIVNIEEIQIIGRVFWWSVFD